MISRQRIENARAIVAALIARDGPVYLPIFERIEAEAAALEAAESAVERARAVAAAGPFQAAAKPPSRSRRVA